MKLTKKDKQRVSDTYPLYGLKGKARVKEAILVKKAKKLAIGHYWNDKEFYEFIAVSKKGKRRYFPYCHLPGEFCDNSCEQDYQEALNSSKKWAKK